MAKKDAGRILSNDRFMTPKFRLNYPNLCARRAEDEKYDPGRYVVQAVFFPNETDTSLMEEIIKKCAADAKYKKGWNSPLRDDEEEGYGEGVKFANLKYYGKKGKPIVVFADKTPVETDDEIVPGSYARAIVRFFAYDKDGGKGVGISLDSIQLLGGGKRFTGGAAAAAAKMAEEEFESGEMEETLDDEDSDFDFED